MADPETRPESSRDDAVWLDHLRWVMDLELRQADRAGQALCAIASVQGVLVTLTAPVVLDMASGGRWLALLAMVVNILGLVSALHLSTPRRREDLSIGTFRDWWVGRKGGRPVPALQTQLVNELIGDRKQGTPSPIRAARDSREARLQGVRRILKVTVASLPLLAAGVTWEVLT